MVLRTRPRFSDAKPRHTLAELLARSDYSRPQPPEEREWIDVPAVGGNCSQPLSSDRFTVPLVSHLRTAIHKWSVRRRTALPWCRLERHELEQRVQRGTGESALR
jgi:hypothetical protein